MARGSNNSKRPLARLENGWFGLTSSICPVSPVGVVEEASDGGLLRECKRATKKLRRYVESHDHAIRLKAEIMVDHFHEQVLALNKVGGQARAMVVTGGIERAVQYYR